MNEATQTLIDSASNLCYGYASVDRAVNPHGVVDVAQTPTHPVLRVHTRTLFGQIVYAHLREMMRGGRFTVELIQAL